MANPSKAKGTGAETELRLELLGRGIVVVRNPAGDPIDLDRPGPEAFDILATRPDRGEWLLSMGLDDFARLMKTYDATGEEVSLPDSGLHIEVKRYARFAHHTIFESKFASHRD
jgi:hypothetical protein